MAKRIGAEDSTTRVILLDATERLILEEGYGAVSTRRVAKSVNLTSALVHYYFPTTDDLLVALFRRASESNMEQLRQALASDRPLRALWALHADVNCTALSLEFLAMSNHRKIIRAEIERSAQMFREAHSEGLAQIVASHALDQISALGMTVMMASVSRLLISERSVGFHHGHAEVEAIVESWLLKLEGASADTPFSASAGSI